LTDEPPSPPPGDAEAERLRAALEEARRRIEELEALAHVDELTGVLNRRGFMQELRRAQSYCERYGVPVALGLVDLDLFKQINDTHGHAAGDAVLVATARFLADHVRASDVVGRIGGDEFAVILWHAEAEQASAKLQALVSGLARVPVQYRDITLTVSATGGAAPLAQGLAFESVLDEADRRLYALKAARGR
jgi:diguanylate cyclase (GGDEF)-like protein